MEPGGLCNARAMSLMDSPAFHRSHNSFLPAADNPPGRPSLATPAPPIRTTPKTLPCCTDRLNPPLLSPPIPINLLTILISAIGGVIGWLFILILHLLGVA